MPKIASNFNYTAIGEAQTDKDDASQMSVQSFVYMLQTLWQSLASIINGNISFGNGSQSDNINGIWSSVTTPGTPNTNFTITHNLGRVPVGYIVMSKTAACDVFTGSIAATST